MTPSWEVVAHPTGYWLVKSGRIVFAVPPKVGHALQTDSIPPGVSPVDWAELRKILAGDKTALASSELRLPPAIWLRLPLLPARLVQNLANALIPLAGRRGLLTMVVLGLVAYTQLGLTSAANPLILAPGLIAQALIIFMATAVWHELGHASALARRGYPPGGVGAGLLFVIPVLFADVTAVGALSTRGKLHVDSAGVAFQLGLGGVAAIFSRLGILGPEGELAAWLALSAVVWSLFPFIKSDGYWLVCDAIGLVDLESDPVPPPGLRLKRFLRTYRLANAAFLLLVGVGLPLRYFTSINELIGHTSAEWQRPEFKLLLLIVVVGILGVVWFNIARRIMSLVRAAI